MEIEVTRDAAPGPTELAKTEAELEAEELIMAQAAIVAEE